MCFKTGLAGLGVASQPLGHLVLAQHFSAGAELDWSRLSQSLPTKWGHFPRSANSIPLLIPQLTTHIELKTRWSHCELCGSAANRKGLLL